MFAKSVIPSLELPYVCTKMLELIVCALVVQSPLYYVPLSCFEVDTFLKWLIVGRSYVDR